MLQTDIWPIAFIVIAGALILWIGIPELIDRITMRRLVKDAGKETEVSKPNIELKSIVVVVGGKEQELAWDQIDIFTETWECDMCGGHHETKLDTPVGEIVVSSS